MGDLRLRVEFEACFSGQQVFLRRWFQPQEGTCRVSELVDQIADEFHLKTRNLLLSLRGIALAPESSVTLLRDGDIIVITANNTLELTGTVLDIRQAAATAPEQVIEAPLLLGSNLSPEKQHSQHTGGLALPSAQIPSSKKDGAKAAEAKKRGKKRKATEDLERDAQQKVPAKTCSSSGKGLATLEEEESGSDSGAADAIPGPVQPGRGLLASEGKPTPSRSARRKKLKRQLIRQGVLPQTKRKRSSALDSAPPAAALPPSVQPALPRRGDPSADHSKHTDFLRTGHIRFAASDDEAPAEGSEESFIEDGEAAEPAAHKEEKPKHWRLPAPPANGGVHPNAPGADEGGSQQPAPQTSHHINYEEMAREEGLPSVGSIVAYKLLEIDANWSPQVSEWRQGKVVAVNAAEEVVLEPWPDRCQRPDASRRPLAAESHEDEDEWEEELPPSDYDDQGVLTTSLSSFADLRSIARGPRPSAPVAAADSPPQPAPPQVSRDPATEQPQAARQTGQPALPEIASASGRATLSPRMVPRVLRQPEQPATQTSNGLAQQTMLYSGIELASAALKATATANETHDGQALQTPAATPDPSAAAAGVISSGRKVLVRTIPRIQRGQSASPANGAGIADQQPDRAPTALSGPATGGSDHRGELAAAIAKRRAELLATDSSSAAAELPNSCTGGEEPATVMNVEAHVPASKQAAVEAPASMATTKASANGTRQVMTPGATKPRPGVKRASMGAFLARLRAESE